MSGNIEHHDKASSAFIKLGHPILPFFSVILYSSEVAIKVKVTAVTQWIASLIPAQWLGLVYIIPVQWPGPQIFD